MTGSAAPPPPSQYGESFADVYDDWYDRGGVAGEVVDALRAHAGGRPDGRLLELGVGTGALAIPLAADGWHVTGLDASPAMLDALAAKLALLPREVAARVEPVVGDAAAPASWPVGPFDVVLAAWNLVTNLADRAAQRAMFEGAAAALAPGGALVVEVFVPAPPDRRVRQVVARPGGGATVVRIHTDADPDTSSIVGRHVELADGRVRVRPWRVCWIDPEELDQVAREAGLVATRRDEDWVATPFAALDSSHHVTWYQRGSARLDGLEQRRL